MSALGEFEIIERFFAPLARSTAGALGLSDDAAVLDISPDRSLVVSTDAIVAGMHFPAPDQENADRSGRTGAAAAYGADVAAKGFAVGFSDLAAMGADPLGYTLAVTLPLSWQAGYLEDWLTGFAAELERWQQATGASLIGGDTVGTRGPLSLTMTVFGTVATGCALRRAGAIAGDTVYVSGTIGDGGLGLEAVRGGLDDLSDHHRRALADRYRRPQPRLALGAKLVGTAHAAADVSDGLVADLGHICSASRVRATVEAERIPLSAAARAALANDPDRLALVLGGGDDYELVFTAPAEATATLARIAGEVNLPLTAIGHIEPCDPGAEARPVTVIGRDGRAIDLSTPGFTHF